MVVNDPKVVKVIGRFGQRLTAALTGKFLPNRLNNHTGDIIVFTGIILVAKNEDDLAAILGHGLLSGFGATLHDATLRNNDCTRCSAAQCGDTRL